LDVISLDIYHNTLELSKSEKIKLNARIWNGGLFTLFHANEFGMEWWNGGLIWNGGAYPFHVIEATITYT